MQLTVICKFESDFAVCYFSLPFSFSSPLSISCGTFADAFTLLLEMSNCLAQLGFLVTRYLPTAETARNHPVLVLLVNRKKDTLGVVLRVEIIMSDGLWINWTAKERREKARATLQCDRHVSIWGG